MTDIAAANVTVTISDRENREGRYYVRGTVAFGNGALTYPSGGIPLAKSLLGFPNKIEDFQIIEETGGSGLIARYDLSAEKLRLFETGAVTPAGTISQVTGTNAASAVTPYYQVDLTGYTAPTPALTHNADPVTNLAAAALYIEEDYGIGEGNCGRLYSTTDSDADVVGSTDDATIWGQAATPRFYVNDSDSPSGVQIYVNESSSDQLEFISPTETDAFIIMPIEAIANSPCGGFALAVKVHHNASADSGKALYFDDNGAADAQLAFVDTGASGGVIPAGDITLLGPIFGAATGNIGTAAAQTFTGGTPTFTGTATTEAAAAELDASSDAPAAQTWEFEAEGW